MSHVIATRARANGIYFERHELAPIGITEGAKCWGLWIEGRHFDKNSKLDTPEKTFVNETPHLAVSAISPQLWPTAFNIEILIDRRAVADPKSPVSSDAFFGVADALLRCGVNILFVSTSQVGYDLVSFRATCEMPRLRPVANAIVAVADAAGKEIQQLRDDLATSGRTDDEIAAALAVKDTEVYRRRVTAFQSLGLHLVPRLAELEMRLIYMDEVRRLYERSSPEIQRARVELAMSDDLAPDLTDRCFTHYLGQTPDKSMSNEARRALVTDALASPWYINEKVAAGGENTYFLSYHSVRDRGSIVESMPDIAPEYSNIYDPHEYPRESADHLHGLVHDIFKSKQLPESLRQVIPLSPHRTSDGKTVTPRSGVAERMLRDYNSESEFRDRLTADFFQRQSLMPVRVSALPSLAHARFWAVGGADGVGKPIAFRYNSNLLRVGSRSAGKADRMSTIYRFLNHATKVGTDAFGPHMAVLANLDTRDRYVRLRFSREPYEIASYLTVRITYKIAGAQASSQGFLVAVSRRLINAGFRIEHASNTLTESDANLECGDLVIVGRASSDAGRKLCKRLSAPISAGTAGARAPSDEEIWMLSLETLSEGRLELKTLRLTPGFVRWDV